MMPGRTMSDEEEVSLCAMRVGEDIFGIDTVKVREVLGRTDRGALRKEAAPAVQTSLRRVPLAPAYVAGLMSYRGEVLTTLSLRALLGVAVEQMGGCVLVLDDEEIGEQIGLMVDGVSGVVMVRKSMLEPNPCTLNARGRALFDGVYKTGSGLIARIDPMRLNQARLAATGLFADATAKGGSGCGH